MADDDVTKSSVTSASDDVTDDVSALAADESSVPAARKSSSHHGDFLSFSIVLIKAVINNRMHQNTAAQHSLGGQPD